MLLRRSLFVFALLVCTTPVAFAEGTTAKTGTGAVLDPWTIREERARTFDVQKTELPTAVREASWIKWQKSRTKLSDHIDRCHFDVRHANRDTLLPITMLCYKGQLVIELESLKRSGTGPLTHSDTLKAELAQKTTDLTGAIQTIMDGIDAKVFPTLVALKDVRKNLLTQYRQPYWLALAHARSDEALTGTAKILVSLRAASLDSDLPAASIEKVTAAMNCYEQAESFFSASAKATSIVESGTLFHQAQTVLPPCNALVEEAAT
ncbi:MAG: hypothetical protein PHE68_05350, partial [Candidatus Peribacteraceae bacterium]|nr:hypothetical protein [Candidatus Peribacteraceae bacterium]